MNNDTQTILILVACALVIVCGIIWLLTRRKSSPADLDRRAIAQSEDDRDLLLRELDQKEFAVGYILESKKRHKLSDWELAAVTEIEGRIAEIKSALARTTFRKPNTDCGYVYVISNPIFRNGVVKIGMTCGIDAGTRIKKLHNTSTPLGFDTELLHYCENAYAVEQRLHRLFSSDRVSPNREFFFATPAEVMAKLSKLEGVIVYISPADSIDKDLINNVSRTSPHHEDTLENL